MTEHPFLGKLELVGQGEPRVLFCDNETNSERLFGTASTTITPEGRDQRPRRLGRADGGGRDGHEGRLLVPADGRARRDGHGAGAPATRRPPRQPLAGLRRGRRRAPRGGRRVLRRADARRDDRRRGARAPPGARRDALEQAALRLRRRALARRRPDPAEAAGLAARRPQHALAHVRRLRHHVDARQVGVPVVRRLGSRVPLRRARPGRSRVREVPADPALPRVVPAPERRARRLRVVVRRRQPAGAGVGGARGVRDRRRPRHRLPRAASSTSCSSTSPGG